MFFILVLFVAWVRFSHVYLVNSPPNHGKYEGSTNRFSVSLNHTLSDRSVVSRSLFCWLAGNVFCSRPRWQDGGILWSSAASHMPRWRCNNIFTAVYHVTIWRRVSWWGWRHRSASAHAHWTSSPAAVLLSEAPTLADHSLYKLKV